MVNTAMRLAFNEVMMPGHALHVPYTDSMLLRIK
jgi:hypothetical protein